MNKKTLNLFKSGDTIEGQITFSMDDVLTFAKLTGDDYPLHIDEEFASASQFGRPIVQGNLAASSFTKIPGTKYPGQTILIDKEITFIRPVYVDEPYILSIKLKSVDYEKNIGEFRSVIKNDEGKICVVFKSRLKNTDVFCNR